MSEPTPTADDAPEAGPDTGASEYELVALANETNDGHEYTVFPAKADAGDLLTAWLTVDEDAIHDRDDWR